MGPKFFSFSVMLLVYSHMHFLKILNLIASVSFKIPF